MLIDWPKLIFSLVLLLPPIALFHGERVRYRAVMRDWDGYWGRTFSLGFHSIDLLRAALGAWLLAEALQRAPEALGMMKYGAIVAKAAILAVAAVLQTSFCREPEAAHAPFAFVSGLVLGFLPPLVAGFGLGLAIVLTMGIHAPSVYFPLLAVTTAALGFLFTAKTLLYELISVTVAVTLPWLITLLFPRHFVSSYRARPKGASLPPPR